MCCAPAAGAARGGSGSGDRFAGGSGVSGAGAIAPVSSTPPGGAMGGLARRRRGAASGAAGASAPGTAAAARWKGAIQPRAATPSVAPDHQRAHHQHPGEVAPDDVRPAAQRDARPDRRQPVVSRKLGIAQPPNEITGVRLRRLPGRQTRASAAPRAAPSLIDRPSSFTLTFAPAVPACFRNSLRARCKVTRTVVTFMPSRAAISWVPIASSSCSTRTFRCFSGSASRMR